MWDLNLPRWVVKGKNKAKPVKDYKGKKITHKLPNSSESTYVTISILNQYI